MDERQIFDQFHESLDVQPRPGAIDRLETALATVNALGQRRRARWPWRDMGAIGELGPGLRLTAGLVALLIAVAGVAVLLISARSHTQTVPGGHSTPVQTPSPSPAVTFTPSPAFRASNWPPGGTVPAELAGSWQSQVNSRQIDLGGYTFQVLPASGCSCGSGNVVVNGPEIYFMTDACTPPSSPAPVFKFGYETYSYTLTGSTLVLVRAADPRQSNCGFGFQGTYTRIATS